MTRNCGAVLLLVVTLLTSAWSQQDEPSPGSPTFLRSAVESMPEHAKKEDLKVFPLGETSLPLRTAVESIPSLSEESEKSFVRSAIEFRPIAEKLQDAPLDSAESSIKPTYAQAMTGHYDAYILPSYPKSQGPQPFRFGSPFQQIVKDSVANQQIFLRGGVKQSDDPNKPKKVLCFITNWSFYRRSDGRFVPEQLDTTLCSHIIYSFASLNPETLSVKEFDKWADLENDLYRRTTSLAQDVPVLLALGGWTDSSGDKYSRLVNDASARRRFVQAIVPFLKQYGFSGLHFDWNYPKCWQSDCRKGPESDRPNFTRLIQELSREFRKESLLLGVAISGYKEVISKAYDVSALSDAADFLVVMSYDYHGAWEGKTGHISPLFSKTDDKYPQYSTDYALNLLIKEGAKRSKLIVGVPFYGQTFTLEEKARGNVGEGTLSRGPGKPGEFTRQPGMLAYYEICENIRNKQWRVERDFDGKSGPHAFKDDQWVGYESVESVTVKAKYVVESGFGGIAAWTVDLDDFSNLCCSEPFPLLHAINRGLKRIDSRQPIGSCRKPPAPVTPVAPVMTPVDLENGAPAQGFHETTTWPSWMPGATTSTSTTQWWQTSTSTQSTPSTEFTWWPTSSTTSRPSTTSARPTEANEIIPIPVNTSPVIVVGEPCIDGEYRPDPNTCASYYYCVYGELRKQECPSGLHWNSRGKLCDWPFTAKCEATPKPSKKPSTTVRPVTIVKQSSSTTLKTTTTKRSTTTTRRSTPTTTRSTTRRTTPAISSYSAKPSTTRRPLSAADACDNGQYYPNLHDCGSYFICVNRVLVPQDCGPGLQWNQDAEECDYETKVRCIASSRYIAFAEKAAVSLDDPCEGDSRVPYPGRCDQYLQCLHGNLQSSDCPPGLHWNNLQQICDWPDSAMCDQAGSEILTGSDGSGASEIDSLNEILPQPASSTTPRPTTPRPEIKPLSGHFKLVCYFTNWAWYRRGIAKYTPDDIDTRLCTHIVYGFAVLDYSTLTIKTHDSWADIDNKFYQRVSDLKSKGVKVSLALGGWNDSQGDKYSRLVRDSASRRRFVTQAVDFIEKYGFEGLDLDWEYPVCWQTECNKGFADEKDGFRDLVRELSVEFKPRGLLLSSAVSPSKVIIDKGYDVPALANYFDWIAVMTYDYHGQWDKRTGHVAPLYYHPDDEFDYFNANFSINYWIEKGAPPRKIVMGMPLYGQSFTLSDTKSNGLNARAPGPGQAGEYTRAAGFLAYYEICDRINNRGWTVVQDPERRLGPYAYKGNQWVSFDDKEMIRRKSQLVRKLGLGGGMVWALDLDDFRNHCGEGEHPLLTEMQVVLRDPPTGADQSIVDEIPATSEQPAQESSSQIASTTQSAYIPPTSNSNEIEADPAQPATQLGSDFKVVCYFTNWAWYRQNGGKYLPEDIDAKLCSHIVYGFAVLDRDTLTIKPHDSWADIDNKFYERVVAYKAKGVRVSVAIGGWNDSAGDKYSRLVRDAQARARFIKRVVEFIEKWNFEGLDLDWEYPVCWQVDCTKGYADEKENFAALVRELSEEFKPRGWLLSSAVSPSKAVIDAGYEVPTLSKYFDWIAVMAYDYHGQWDKQTGHVAPMYRHPEDVTPTFNTNFTIHYWIESGADPRKLVLGMPMYGQSFSLAENKNHGLNSQSYGGGEAGERTRARGFLAYYEICENIQQRGWKVVRDRRGRMGPYAYSKDQWVSFDDALMIKHKSEYVKAMNLGGAMIWALDLDDFQNICNCEEYPLLRTINRVLRNYPGPHPKCQLESLPEIQDSVIVESASSTTEQPRSTKRPATTKTTRPTSTARPAIPSSTEDEEETPIEIDCSSGQFVPHESDCNQYYICNNGQPLAQNCPPGLHWNDNHCDWPHNARCESSESGESGSGITPKPTSPRPTTMRPSRKPRPTLPANAVAEVDDGKYKVVCYFTNWAWYRPGEGKYRPEDIDDNLCTHIVYGFAVLNGDTLKIKTHDSWADIDNHFYEKVTALRKRGKRVVVAIGGWNDSLGDKYSRLVLNADNRANFVTDVIEFIEKYNFEGLDLDWEYPVCWQVECHKGKPQEKEGFAELVRELSEEFKPRGWLLSAAVSPSKMVIDVAYDVPSLAKHFDWIAVMTYDFHGNWDRQTGHVAPLYYYPGDKWANFNANYTINYFIEKGAPSRKLVMGVPLYGQSFRLNSASNYGLNAPSSGPGEAGKFTRAAGFLSFYEICEKTNQGGWKVERDSEGRIGPYAHHSDQWVSYDDVVDVRRKAKYMKKMNLGGGMIWALDLDDFRGSCGCGKHPLLTTLNQVLRDIGGPKIDNCT